MSTLEEARRERGRLLPRVRLTDADNLFKELRTAIKGLEPAENMGLITDDESLALGMMRCLETMLMMDYATRAARQGEAR